MIGVKGKHIVHRILFRAQLGVCLQETTMDLSTASGFKGAHTLSLPAQPEAEKIASLTKAEGPPPLPAGQAPLIRVHVVVTHLQGILINSFIAIFRSFMRMRVLAINHCRAPMGAVLQECTASLSHDEGRA